MPQLAMLTHQHLVSFRYKLRARVDVADASGEAGVWVNFGPRAAMQGGSCWVAQNKVAQDRLQAVQVTVR